MMKIKPFHLFLALGLLFAVQTSKAQENSGANKYILGGGVNFLSQKNAYPLTGTFGPSGLGGVFSGNSDPIQFLTLGISPYFGKSLGEHWVIGLQSSYSYTRFKREVFILPSQAEAELVEKSNAFGLGIFARYAVNPGDRLQLFAQPSVGYNLLTGKVFDENEELVNEEKADFLRAGAGLGLLFELNDNWRLLINTGVIEYLNGKSEDVDAEESRSFSSFATSLNLTNIRFGVELKL